MKTPATIAAITLVAPAAAFAQPLVDGVGMDPANYNFGRRATQTVQTGFGDNASEWNAAYADVSNGRLTIGLTGNLEANFNKLDIFIDVGAGGQNQLDGPFDDGGTNPNNDSWADNYAGFTFDDGFTADFGFIFRRGDSKFDVDFFQVGGGENAFDGVSNNAAFEDVFGGSDEGSASGIVGSLLPSGLDIGYDNSNVAGIGGSAGDAADQAAAEAVTTGLEFSVALADLGNPALHDIKVSVQQNGGSHDFLSNQFLGGLPVGTGNLGNDGAGNFVDGNLGSINLNDFAGDQFFNIPAPGTVALAGLAGLAATRRRRA